MAKENSPFLILKSNKLERIESRIPNCLNYNNIIISIKKKDTSFRLKPFQVISFKKHTKIKIYRPKSPLSMSKSISFRFRFTLLNERDPLKHKRDVLRMANETLVLIQDIVVE